MRIDMGEIEKLRRQLHQDGPKMVQAAVTKITLDVQRELMEASPVDTGEFRAKWTAETPSAPGQGGTVENHTPQAVPLAKGHSKQAPAGWIENIIEKIVRQFK